MMELPSPEELSRTPTPSSHSTDLTTPSYPVQSLTGSKTSSQSPTDYFGRWRPSFHVIAPTGWMNDPCAPGYDPKTGLYHISFQWNPYGPDWDDISWGSATSRDMITWTINERPTLCPDKIYDCKGVFTGCFVNGLDGSLIHIYTSVSALPIHHTIPHLRGSETLSLAKSFDNGMTWKKDLNNPILHEEPLDLDVTGFRDPYCGPWYNMSKFLALDAENIIFGIISGGIRDVTPTTFLYSINANDLSEWKYICPLINCGINFRPSRWSGDLGRNWEVTNFFSLSDEHDSSLTRDFLLMGTEGCLSDSVSSPSSFGPSRPSRGQLWMSGSLKEGKASPVEMTYDYGGHLDYGCFYAANSFFDENHQRRIVWGWVTEEDLCDDLRYRQGWSGMLSMPRELRMVSMQNVIGASASDLSSITSINLDPDNYGSHTLRTVASQPFQPLIERLRQGPKVKRSRLNRSKLAPNVTNVAFRSEQIESTKWELDCSFKVSKQCVNVGVRVGHSSDFSSATILRFTPSSETFTIIRPSLSTPGSEKLINSDPEFAPHTLFTSKEHTTGDEVTESLHIRAWRDNSVLEVFVNGRTAISTRLYAADETFGMQFFAEYCNDRNNNDTELIYAELWDGIGVN